MNGPAPGSAEEIRQFQELQKRLAWQFQTIFPDPHLPRCVVVVPSLSMDAELLAKIVGVQHYEERLLCMLMLLRMPRTRIVYVTSVPIDPTIIDYYLHLLPGVPSKHARNRLELFACHDASTASITRKVLDRPRLLHRIRQAVGDPMAAHMTCFNATALERSLAVRLGIPLYACDPSLAHLGGKSGGREVLREADVPVPDGFEHLRDMNDVAEALSELKRRNPDLRRAVVKLEEGASGEGNALFDFDDCPEDSGLARWIRGELPARLQFEARDECWDGYRAGFLNKGGVVEEWIDGPGKRSPSVQCRIDPLGGIDIVSTHDQVLGGPTGQVFQACHFPADGVYRLDIQAAGTAVGRILRDRGVLGRYGVDYVSLPEGDGWRHFAVEINLRKGGTTHSFMMLQFLTAGSYEPDTGCFLTPSGQSRCYYATDNLRNPLYRRMTPEDMIDVAVDHGLHFHGASQQGVVFHLIGALSEFGKLGMVCVADEPKAARDLYRHTVAVLDAESLSDGPED